MLHGLSKGLKWFVRTITLYLEVHDFESSFARSKEETVFTLVRIKRMKYSLDLTLGKSDWRKTTQIEIYSSLSGNCFGNSSWHANKNSINCWKLQVLKCSKISFTPKYEELLFLNPGGSEFLYDYFPSRTRAYKEQV